MVDPEPYEKCKKSKSLELLSYNNTVRVVLDVAGELAVATDAVGELAVVIDAVGEPGVVFDVVLSGSTWRSASRTFRSCDLSRRAERLRSCFVRSLCCRLRKYIYTSGTRGRRGPRHKKS